MAGKPRNKTQDAAQKVPQQLADTVSRVNDSVRRQTDYYSFGHPGSRNLGPILPVAQYPHLISGIWSTDTSLWQLFEEMQDKDGHLVGCIDTRLGAVTSLSRRINPASANDEDHKISAAVKAMFKSMPDGFDSYGNYKEGFDCVLLQILSAIPYGLSILEIAWGPNSDGLVVPVKIWHHHPSLFRFDRNGSILMDGEREAPTDPAVMEARRRRFLVIRRTHKFGDPYGHPLLGSLLWQFWFKKQIVRYVMLASERIGIPPVIGTMGPNAGEAEQKAFKTAVENLTALSSAVFPDGSTAKLLEGIAADGQFGVGLRALLDWWDDQVSKRVLGATLTSGEGKRTGSMALGNVHAGVAGFRVEDDARVAMRGVGAIIRMFVDFNFGPKVEAPEFLIDTNKGEDLLAAARMYDLVQNRIGAPMEKDHIYRRFDIPVPKAGADVFTPLPFGATNATGQFPGTEPDPNAPSPDPAQPADPSGVAEMEE